MRARRVTFENEDGMTLSGRVDLPADAEAVAFALFAHCFTCSRNLRAAGALSEALTEMGFGVLRFDFTGLGDSEGEFADTNFSSNVRDLVAAAGFMSRELGAPRLLVGHSFGGAAAIHAAHELPSVGAVATLAAPSSPEHLKGVLRSHEDEIRRAGEAQVELAGRTFRIKRQFLDDLEATRMDEAVSGLGRHLLVMHAPADKLVDVQHGTRLFETAVQPKSFLSLPGADHLLSRQEDARHAGRMLAAWSAGALDEAAEVTKTPGTTTSVAASIGRDHYHTRIVAGGHTLVADEPLSVGGGNHGPTPYDLVLAGLGACTAITLRMYADRKGWPLEAVTAHLEHDKVHKEAAETCDERPRKLDRFTRRLELVGDLSADQRDRLLDIANRCPVHRTLESEAVSETTLSPGGPDRGSGG